MEARLSIGEVAQKAGISVSAIRFYEGKGLLPEAERVSGQRRFTAEAVQRLGTIEVAKQAGFSLDEVRELLEGSEQSAVSGRLRALAQRKLPEVEETIARAQSMKAWLEAANGCECAALDVCALFDRGTAAPGRSGG